MQTVPLSNRRLNDSNKIRNGKVEIRKYREAALKALYIKLLKGSFSGMGS